MIYGKTIYGNKVKIKKNTICYESEKGHKNFYYPSENKLIIKEEYYADVIPWISGGSRIALRIPKKILTPLNIGKNTKLNISPPPNTTIIVWVDKCLLN
tara:strand:- start:1270 stop:1566 length:297 start_codon:yes stop_codon:yes gene_type:complete